jgi:hypothetical protein
MLRRLMEIVYDGKPEAADQIAKAAASDAAQRKEDRAQLHLPADPAVVKGLAKHYYNSELGNLRLSYNASGATFTTDGWKSIVATRKHDDGSISLVSTNAQIVDLEFVVGKDKEKGKRTLTLRDSQHEYVFTES